MEQLTVEKWQQNQDVEVYFNSVTNRLTLKKFNFIHTVCVESQSSQPYHDLKRLSNTFIAAAFSATEEYLAFQVNSYELEVVHINTFTQFAIAGGKSRSILGFQWVEQPGIDFFLVTNSGVDFYKLNHKTHKLTHVKGFMQTAGHYWYHQGVLIIAASPPRLGTFITFFLNRGPKSLPGPRFNIDLTPSVTDNWTAKAVNSTRITDPHDSEPYLHRVILCSLYGDTVFVHVNSVHCRMTLYGLFEDRVEVKDNFDTLPNGKFDIHITDSVLMIMNLTMHETYLYDIKSTKCPTRPFCTIWNGIQVGVPELSIKISAIVDKPNLVIVPTILIDNRHITEDSISIAAARSPLGHIIETSLDINHKLVSLGPELLLDIEAGRCYRIMVDFNEVVREHSDRLESILFLFRRNGYRVLGFEYLRQAIRSKVPLIYLSTFFDTINSVYKIASQERSQVLARRNTFSGNVKDLYREEVKSDSGVTVLLQSDMYGSIFIPLFEQQSVDPLYFTSVVLEYVRSLIALEIPLHLNSQMLLARLLVRAHSFVLLQELVLYSTFNDSRDLAHLLLSLSKSPSEALFPSAFQLAIDMLTRLKLFDEVADVLLSRGYCYEVARLCASANPPRFDINKLYKEAEGAQDAELLEAVKKILV
mmetsp:Transcript_2603/g.5893  ORF Transcript_2603/g.5893 Transcript_2603/m.5893 type:complete len:645 (+) Transcript_2603:1348-3282(+)|eukprot:CAMPEP_0204896480 /NCGR_PEP_ID=MMETSP1397-20131031/185_1 /ASSEMBLY_ACC=CAM_ASM_000891 /TAXON_ID=49980 /ORGANISM="Climacostomum Climacostomum virens, Strain Stock W-24" /LENGTH=644 /DNA_ID=CAMNT_0052064087 /DNA_START=687 /DNA_END=2621 /DNA_ORIENTATION=+